MYGKYGEVTATRGKIHECLGMTFDFSEPGTLKLDMVDYVEKMLASLKFTSRSLGNSCTVASTPNCDRARATASSAEISGRPGRRSDMV